MPLRRGPGLIRTVGRTAVVAGTATATRNAVGKRQAKKNAAEQAGVTAAPSPPAPAEPPPVADSATDDKLSQLERLAQLKAQGILTEEEFAAQKAEILAK